MREPLGRREQHKQATRAALNEAARKLFAERGFEATTVREIAEAADVTERTFYRYFDGKEDLLADAALAWVEKLKEAIRTRPTQEPPLVAVKRALAELLPQVAVANNARTWKPTDGLRPLGILRRSTGRPLLKLENAIAAALLARAEEDDHTPIESDSEFRAQVQARVAVAALRSTILRHRELAARGGRSPSTRRLLEEAFAALEASQ